MLSRIFTHIRLLRAIYGFFIGALLGLLMASIVLFTDPSPYEAWPSYHGTGMLVAWGVFGAAYGFIGGFIIQIIGELTRSVRNKQLRDDSRLAKTPPSKRQLLRMRRFWIPFYVILFLGPMLSLWRYWQTYQIIIDGYDEIGWPMPFFLRGGYCYHEYHDLMGLTLDIAVWIAMATVAGLLVREGPRRFSIKCLLSLRNILGASKRWN